MQRVTHLMHTFEIKILFDLPLIMLLLTIKNIHLCEDSDHVNAMFSTDTQLTHMVFTVDLVPVGTIFVTPGL